MITSAENRAWHTDVPFGDCYAGLRSACALVIRPAKLATIEARHAERLGEAPPDLMRRVMESLRDSLGL